MAYPLCLSIMHHDYLTEFNKVNASLKVSHGQVICVLLQCTLSIYGLIMVDL